MFKETNQFENRITIKTNNEFQFFPTSSITLITCDSSLSTIHFLDIKQNICVGKLLKEFENELADKGFIRINHNAIANTRCIKSFDKETRCITFINDTKYNVSVRKTKNVISFFKNENTLTKILNTHI